MYRLISILLPIASLLVAGCASTVEEMYTPAGRLGYNISCDNGFGGGAWGDCFRQASELCGGQGYKVFGRHFEPGGFYVPARRTLLIGCGQ